MRKYGYTDEELRFTLHDAAPMPEGTVITGSVQAYSKFGPSDRARWNDCPGALMKWPTNDREWAAQYEPSEFKRGRDEAGTVGPAEEQPGVIGPARSPLEPLPLAPCECHENMGNDFYFLPMDACLRRDGKCTKGPAKGFVRA